jgi:Cytochrome c oxidase subunit IV
VKVEAWFFGGGGPLFLVFAIVYGAVTGWNEPVGAACLFLTAGLALLIGAYLGYTGRHIDARPEDDPFGEIAEGAGELGEFPPYSWWPLATASGGAVLFAGLAIGWWVVFIGAGLAAVGVVGWVYEFYRGEHAH